MLDCVVIFVVFVLFVVAVIVVVGPQTGGKFLRKFDFQQPEEFVGVVSSTALSHARRFSLVTPSSAPTTHTHTCTHIHTLR